MLNNYIIDMFDRMGNDKVEIVGDRVFITKGKHVSECSIEEALDIIAEWEDLVDEVEDTEDR